MCAAICRSEEIAPILPASARARGLILGEFQALGGRTRIARVRESGGLRLKFPNARPHCEAVAVNTAGGVCGGDHAELSFSVGAQGALLLTTQSAEKIYRAQSGRPEDCAHLDVRLNVGASASLLWAPQETILFAGANLARRIDLDFAADARVTLLESVVFGRLAMGEVASGRFHDRWRLRRNGALVFAEDMRLDGALADILDRPACGAGARAVATLFHAAPDAEQQLEPIREALATARCEGGASAWNGFCLVRLVSPLPERLRAVIPSLLAALGHADLPRVWN